MTTETYDGFHVERDAGSGIATITLDVPEKMNRVSMAARDQLAGVFGELGTDDAVRVVVLGGAGEKAFTAGGDIPGFMTRTPEELSHLAKNIAAAERCPKPVVAKLHGFTFGVGLELALGGGWAVRGEGRCQVHWIELDGVRHASVGPVFDLGLMWRW